MEKDILKLLISLITSYFTEADIFTSYGIVCFILVFVEAITWLIKRIYFNKEKTPSRSHQE